jgi:hypothetical protein
MRCTSRVLFAAAFCGRSVRLKSVEGNRVCTRRAVEDEHDDDDDDDVEQVVVSANDDEEEETAVASPCSSGS